MLNFVYAEKGMSEKGLKYGQKKKVGLKWKDDSFSGTGGVFSDYGYLCDCTGDWYNP